MTAGKILHTLEGHAMPIRGLTFSSDSQLLLTGSDDSHIKIYDVYVYFFHIKEMFLRYSITYRQNANLAGTLSGHASYVLNVDFSPDNQHFVSW